MKWRNTNPISAECIRWRRFTLLCIHHSVSSASIDFPIVCVCVWAVVLSTWRERKVKIALTTETETVLRRKQKKNCSPFVNECQAFFTIIYFYVWCTIPVVRCMQEIVIAIMPWSFGDYGAEIGGMGPRYCWPPPRWEQSERTNEQDRYEWRCTTQPTDGYATTQLSPPITIYVYGWPGICRCSAHLYLYIYIRIIFVIGCELSKLIFLCFVSMCRFSWGVIKISLSEYCNDNINRFFFSTSSSLSL